MVDGGVRLKELNCLSCNHILSAAKAIEEDAITPKEGDVSICVYCGDVAIYTEEGLRPPNKEEQKEIDSNDFIRKAKRLIEIKNLFT